MMSNKAFIMQQVRRALELFVQSLGDESTMMEVADVYPEYRVGIGYKTGDIFRWGANGDGETQLYQVLQDHVSSAEWKPETAVSLYKKIGFSGDVPIWTQPLGQSDAYMLNDVVMHNGEKWQSDYDNNVWEPGVFGWHTV